MDYRVLRWKLAEGSAAIRQFFIRQFSGKEAREKKLRENSVLVLNVPPYCEEHDLQGVFTKFGSVRQLEIFENLDSVRGSESLEGSKFFTNKKEITGYKVAVVTFENSNIIKKLLATCKEDMEPAVYSTAEMPLESGIPKWLKQRRRHLPSLVDLKAEIDQYMESYDKTVHEEKEKLKALEGQPDEDGWVTVTRVGKKRGIRQEKVMGDGALPEAKRRAGEKELSNFYKFQTGTSKITQLAELKRKFEEDKQKIAHMKANRKFKPV